MVDFRVTVFDGSYHDVDSNEMSFKMAGRLAFKDAMTRAVAENRSHYVQTTGIPRLVELAAEKMRRKNGIRCGSS